MRATSMSFFKTAKSTFMSTNDLESENLMTENQAWADSSAVKVNGQGFEYEAESDLAGNTDQIIAGGSLSILRRKGKQFKERGRRNNQNENDVLGGRGARYYQELLSSDI